jgi:hypothetical protein
VPTADSIIENSMVGGFVAPADVPAAREWFVRHRDRILSTGDHVELSLAKIDEALALAARLGHGFCEATEIVVPEFDPVRSIFSPTTTARST